MDTSFPENVGMNLDPSSLFQKPTNHSGTCRLDFLWLRSLFSGEHLMVEVIV